MTLLRARSLFSEIGFFTTVIFLAMVLWSVTSQRAEAAESLSQAQVQAILNLLSSFGADASIMQNVEVALRGGASPGSTSPGYLPPHVPSFAPPGHPSLGTVKVQTNHNGNPLAVKAIFQLGSPCSDYTLTWGDGTDFSHTSPSGMGCIQMVPDPSSATHTYAQAGTYTVTFQTGGNPPSTQTVKVGEAQVSSNDSVLPTRTSSSGLMAKCQLPTRVLMHGSVGQDVAALQAILAEDPEIYPSGQITGYFGAQTRAAVERFQARSGIVSSGDALSTGYGMVGAKTRLALGTRCGSTSSQMHALSALPSSGSAPLKVSFSYTIGGSFIPESNYSIDFGDGTASGLALGCGVALGISATSGACPRAVVASHTYANPGTYVAKLLYSGNPACYYSSPPCLMPAVLNQLVGSVTVVVK